MASPSSARATLKHRARSRTGELSARRLRPRADARGARRALERPRWRLRGPRRDDRGGRLDRARRPAGARARRRVGLRRRRVATSRAPRLAVSGRPRARARSPSATMPCARIWNRSSTSARSAAMRLVKRFGADEVLAAIDRDPERVLGSVPGIGPRAHRRRRCPRGITSASCATCACFSTRTASTPRPPVASRATSARARSRCCSATRTRSASSTGSASRPPTRSRARSTPRWTPPAGCRPACCTRCAWPRPTGTAICRAPS